MKLIKQIITIPVNSNISRFFIYFFNFKLKNIRRPTIVGGQSPIKIAFSKFPSTKYIYSEMKIKKITTKIVKSSDFLNFVNIISFVIKLKY